MTVRHRGLHAVSYLQAPFSWRDVLKHLPNGEEQDNVLSATPRRRTDPSEQLALRGMKVDAT